MTIMITMIIITKQKITKAHFLSIAKNDGGKLRRMIIMDMNRKCIKEEEQGGGNGKRRRRRKIRWRRRDSSSSRCWNAIKEELLKEKADLCTDVAIQSILLIIIIVIMIGKCDKNDNITLKSINSNK